MSAVWDAPITLTVSTRVVSVMMDMHPGVEDIDIDVWVSQNNSTTVE